MARHEFAIMQRTPLAGERIDSYEPEKYTLLSVDDDWIAPLLPALDELDFFWHTVDCGGKGLAYCGITLIPPAAMDKMVQVIGAEPALFGLRTLLVQARAENKFVLHYGL